GYRSHLHLGPIGKGRPDTVASVDIDVLYFRIVDEGLKGAQTEEGVESRSCKVLLALRSTDRLQQSIVVCCQPVQVGEHPLAGGPHPGLPAGAAGGAWGG